METTFQTTYLQFLEDLKGTFPEYVSALTFAATLPNCKERFKEVWCPRAASVASRDDALFASGVELVSGFVLTNTLWSELSPNTQTAIWKYLSTLLLLVVAEDSASADVWDISGFQTSMADMMNFLKLSGGDGDTFSGMFEQLGKMMESFGLKDLSGAAADILPPNFKIPEKLFKGHIAKIVEELVKEFNPEDFGITPEMIDSKDPKAIFNLLQEIFTKKPDLLMSAGQKIAKKLQAKFQSGSIRREEIIREVEELMKEFSDNEAFSQLFGSLGDLMKMSEKTTGNEGSARRREVQERLRRKQAEKEARRAGTSNVVVYNSVDDATREAAYAALIAEEEAATVAASTKRAKQGKKH